MSVKLTFGYTPDADQDVLTLFEKHSWLCEIWDICMDDIAKRIYGPVIDNPSNPLSGGFDGEGYVALIPENPTQISDKHAAYYVLTQLNTRFLSLMFQFIISQQIYDLYLRLLCFLNMDKGQEICKASISFLNMPSRNDIEICATFKILRSSECIKVVCSLVEEITGDQRQLQNIWMKNS
jgi:hypothetical protein